MTDSTGTTARTRGDTTMAHYSVMITFPPTLAEQRCGVRIGSSRNPVIEAATPSDARAIARKRYPGGTVVRVSAHAGGSPQ